MVSEVNTGLTSNVSPTNSGYPTQGVTHAEHKILANIDRQLGGDKNATGTVTINVDKTPCGASCQQTIRDFGNKYPNIDLKVNYSIDRILPKKQGQ